MIFHDPDRTFRRLASMQKRAFAFASPGFDVAHRPKDRRPVLRSRGPAGPIDPRHHLAAAWSNCKMMLDAENGDPTAPATAEDRAWSISVLDWFASKVEIYAQQHMLKGDQSFAAIAHEFLLARQCDFEAAAYAPPLRSVAQ